MTDELEVQTRHKKLLEKIRKDHADERDHGPTGFSDEKVSDAIGRNQTTERYRSGSEGQGRTESRQARRFDEEDGSTQRITGGSDSGTGQANATSINAIESDDSIGGETGESGAVESPSPWELEEEESAKEKSDRRKELARLRQQKHREKQRAESSTEASPLRDIEKKDVTFSLKNIFKSDEKKEPDKPLLMKEADDETRRKLIDLYIRGSSILDDVLEIIVKGHEPVSIWELSEEEAAMLVDMQLERARKSAAEARVVRKLVAIYDRLFFAMLLGSRAKATHTYIDEHGGFSFR